MYTDFIKTLEMLGVQQWAAILTIVGIPTIFFKILFYKAKHKISFEPKETYHEATLVDQPGTPQSFWIQLMVKNKGYEVSKNSEAYLSDVWLRENGRYKRVNEFRAPVKLKWSHEEDIFPINILPRERRRLDVCYICEGQDILHIMAKGFPSGTIKNTLKPADYLFIIKTISDNSLSPAEFILNVNWNGEWKNLKGQKYVKSFQIYEYPVRSFRFA